MIFGIHGANISDELTQMTASRMNNVSQFIKEFIHQQRCSKQLLLDNTM